MKHTFLIKDWLCSFLSSLVSLVVAFVCGRSLAKGEGEFICAMCNIDLPRTDYHLRKRRSSRITILGLVSSGTGHFFFLLSERE